MRKLSITYFIEMPCDNIMIMPAVSTDVQIRFGGDLWNAGASVVRKASEGKNGQSEEVLSATKEPGSEHTAPVIFDPIQNVWSSEHTVRESIIKF